MSDHELLLLINKARSIAIQIGSMHALWDVIFDAEAILAGRASIMTRKEVEVELQKVTPTNIKPNDC